MDEWIQLGAFVACHTPCLSPLVSCLYSSATQYIKKKIQKFRVIYASSHCRSVLQGLFKMSKITVGSWKNALNPL